MSVHIYPHEHADEFMCFSACLNMIFRRRELPRFEQEILAYELGLVIPDRLREKYPKAKISNEDNLWGVHTEENSISDMFSKYNIPLVEKYYHYLEIPPSNYYDFLQAHLVADNDIIVGYDYATVFLKGSHVGHVSLIYKVDDPHDIVYLVDPDIPDTNLQKVNMRTLLSGTRLGGGIWIIGVSTTVNLENEAYYLI